MPARDFMNTTIKRTFLLLVIIQTLHSAEEYAFGLWEFLAPARYLSGLVSDDLSIGFAVINAAIILAIFLSYLISVRRGGEHSRQLVGFWAVLEILNGVGHLWFAFSESAYFPGLYTAPFVIALGAVLLLQLRE